MVIPIFAAAQISEGGYPDSYDMSDDRGNYLVISLGSPDIENILAKERAGSIASIPHRVGEPMACDLDLVKNGSWGMTDKGKDMLRLGIRSEEAKGLVLYYKNFSIPEGGRLFIYSRDREQLVGAFTNKNNPSGGYFATEMIKGEELVLEYNPPEYGNAMPVIIIDQVHYIYKDVLDELKAGSGPCEVNVNCPEGSNWQNEKRSVAKILLTDGSGTFACTGTLLNNTSQDTVPYFLTARHCGSGAAASHFAQWVFYFNYESPDCEAPLQDPPSKTITGSTLIAEAPDGPSNGSDFRLLRLNTTPPEDYNPWYSGWSYNGLASPSGVGIHHPKGDIKKISTYIDPLVSTAYGSISPNPDGNYWKVIWVETESGHGVTEGGSSGSPIFNNEGKLVGTLTGGAASCTNLDQPDYYGKFSKHWDDNGSTLDSQLKPWLDPEGTGHQSMDGFGYGNLLSANFKADTTVVSIGGSVSFEDLTVGEPEQWEWTFSGGTPSSYTGQNPSGITYNKYGEYGVRLIVRDGDISNELFRERYIRVTPNLYPNPAHDMVTLDFGRRQLEYIEADLFDMNGHLVGTYATSNIQSGIWEIQLDNYRVGNYILRIKTDVMEDSQPLVIY